VGGRSAQEATTDLLERFDPDLIVSAGFAGGVRTGINTGDLFVCDRLMSLEGPPAYWRSGDARERISDYRPSPEEIFDRVDGAYQEYALGGCLSLPQFVTSSSMKSWIGSSFPVSIIDMESYWVSQEAESHGIPSMAVRSVFDPVEQSLPTFVGDTVQEEGAGILRRAMKYILANPVETPRLISLAGQVKIARASLAEFLMALASKGV
jgi:nucleoside phosphorylase